MFWYIAKKQYCKLPFFQKELIHRLVYIAKWNSEISDKTDIGGNLSNISLVTGNNLYMNGKSYITEIYIS